MKIIISPAKRMNTDNNYFEVNQPLFLKESGELLKIVRSFTQPQLQYILECNEVIAHEAYKQYQYMDLNECGTAALLSYQGIQYTSMAPHVFTDEQLAYCEAHVRILSGFYGLLRPFDGVLPYRLELNNRFKYEPWDSLYAFWGNKLYESLDESSCILDLSSVQYSKIIRRYKKSQVRMIKCYFMEQCDDGYKEKGVYVKKARGEMVRYLAEIKAEEPEAAQGFDRLGYHFQPTLSNHEHYVFTRDRFSMNKYK